MCERSVKAHANGRNKCQQLPTLLGVVGQQCCVRLHGPKSLTGFKVYATSANECQSCCGSMQTDATSHNIVGPNNVGCCWPTMLRPFAWALRLKNCPCLRWDVGLQPEFWNLVIIMMMMMIIIITIILIITIIFNTILYFISRELIL